MDLLSGDLRPDLRLTLNEWDTETATLRRLWVARLQRQMDTAPVKYPSVSPERVLRISYISRKSAPVLVT